MNAAAPPDPRVAHDPLVMAAWALLRDLEAASGGEDEETEEARRTGAPEGRERAG
jgi:hypothetical protein